MTDLWELTFVVSGTKSDAEAIFEHLADAYPCECGPGVNVSPCSLQYGVMNPVEDGG